ncbi:MAG: TonB-dependent receptor [Gammaproteobacteria bacterium]|nr:TonB-dependent receptor [Gammaproteobacteria bacterium]
MARHSRIPQPVLTVSAAVLAVLSGQALANATELEEITVTGSHIMRAAEAEAMPLRVVSADDLKEMGSPTLMEAIRAMPEAVGSIGNSNQSQPGKGQGYEGAESINLRGLGPDRNLVLLNGHRLPPVGGYHVNTRNLPMAIIERVEILKDSASSTYGSDALTGAVNFITRKNFKGFEVGGDYTAIDGSDGDYRMDATWGHVADTWNIMISGGYQSRSALKQTERDWSVPSYAENPDAGWNFSANPSAFTPVGPVGANGVLAATGTRQIDVGCAALGSTLVTFAPTTYCINQVTRWQNIVAPAKTYQLFGEFNMELTDSVDFHVEANYAKALARVDYPPSFNQPKPITETVLPSNINPASFQPGTSPRLFANWFVPLSNPGVAAYAAANPSQFPANTTGIFIPIGQWRPYLLGGNPFFGDSLSAPAFQRRDQEEYRLSASLTGKFSDAVNWHTDITWGQNQHYLNGWDSTGVQIELALRGLGGPNCAWQTAAPGSAGCLWLNPMSNAIPGAPINGVAVNPGYVPAVANTKELADWLMIEQERFPTSTMTEVNAGVDGAIEQWNLGGGAVRWAAGIQYRRNSFVETDSEYADRTRVPCLNSPLDIPNADVCTPTPYTPLGLAVALAPVNITSNIYAGYVEAVLPITDRSNVTFGARYEDYGNDGGSTFNPQLRGKFQMFDWLALRASAGTSFRAPPQTSLAPNPSAQIPTILGQPRALDIMGNPDLKPEEAEVYSVGFIVQAGNFEGTVDYYHYDITNILTTEPQNAIVNALFPNGAAGANNCLTADPDFIADHFVFTGACSAANLAKVMLLRINGPDASFSGIDLNLTYWFDLFGGRMTLGAVANKTLTYEFEPFSVAGLAIPGFDAVGKLNVGTLAHPLPEYKGNAYVNYRHGPVNVRWTARHNDSYIDQRQSLTGIGRNIDSSTLHDFAAVVELPRNIQLTFAVGNIFDEEPPLVRVAEGFDAMTADPLGRNYRLGLRVQF